MDGPLEDYFCFGARRGDLLVLGRPLIYHVYMANWVIICYLPPIPGTRKLHWIFGDQGFFTLISSQMTMQDCSFAHSLDELRATDKWGIPSCPISSTWMSQEVMIND